MAAALRFEDLFRAAQMSAVHLEMRDAYALDQDYRDWQTGDRFDPAERWPEWFNLVTDTVSRGVAVKRVRIVSEPVSDYIRYEWDVTSDHNIKAGEDVRWLPRRLASTIALPGNDFWLFDEQTVLFNHFAGDGVMTGEEVVTAESVVRLCADAFNSAWRQAIPHQDYRPN